MCDGLLSGCGWWHFYELTFGSKVGDEVVDLGGGQLLAEWGHSHPAVVDLLDHLLDGFALADELQVRPAASAYSGFPVAEFAALSGEEFCAVRYWGLLLSVSGGDG